MQNFELLLLLVASVYIIFSQSINKNINKYNVIGLLILTLATCFIFDGARWQMIPSLILWFIALCIAIIQPEKKSNIFLRIFKIAGFIILMSLSVVLPVALPVFDLPKTTGSYTIGTMDKLLVLDRDEVITSDSTDSRSIMIKVWYPSNESDGKRDHYVDKAGRSGFAENYGLPPSMLNYLDNVETNVYREIQIADETFPVLIFSHGYNSIANGYYALLSELVSHGYVIFAINHTYESTGSTFPDGTKKFFNYEYASKIEEGTWSTIQPAIEAYRDGQSFEDRHPLIQEALSTYFVKDMIERWANDVVDVVSELDKWNSEGFFNGKLDVSNIGVIGHSRGGGAAGESLLIDERIKVGVNIDGVQWGQIVNTEFQKPFLYLSSDWPPEHENLNQHAYVNKSTSTFYEAVILQSGHSNFMDIPLMIPVQPLNQAGNINSELALRLTGNIITSFFDKYLTSKIVDMNALSTDYDLIKMNVFQGDSIQSIMKETDSYGI